jgi:phosphate/sulfate permease
MSPVCALAEKEFLGALLLGSRVAETVRSQIGTCSVCVGLTGEVNIQEYDRDPPVLMLGMLCALMASSVASFRRSKG